MEKDGNRSQELYKRTLKFGFVVLVLFFLSAIGGSYAGKLIDNQFGTYPYGYISMFVLSYVVSILMCLYLVKRFNLLTSKNKTS